MATRVAERLERIVDRRGVGADSDDVRRQALFALARSGRPEAEAVLRRHAADPKSTLNAYAEPAIALGDGSTKRIPRAEVTAIDYAGD